MKKARSSTLDRVLLSALVENMRPKAGAAAGVSSSSCDPQIIESAYLESLAQLSRIIELRDDRTGEHTAAWPG